MRDGWKHTKSNLGEDRKKSLKVRRWKSEDQKPNPSTFQVYTTRMITQIKDYTDYFS